ncbi:UPF0149 family protein [Aquabacterium sp.]|uniref:UPF0149 family protein n=1 Tax=Aquabacterium sp. TaxID=1872578 RepID=UPI002C5CAF32|nr:UPF0149 family protein [Aquabacterium sp.]HSW03215.1 UPF0149 family protein [Aquabacterium sp.]
MSSVVKHSSEADIENLEKLCERLAGFGVDVSLEWVDGFMTALLASRRAIAEHEWLPAMFGDAFGRAFADPDDVQQAMATLSARWAVLANQLDPEALLEAPDELRISPMMIAYDEEARREVVAGGHMTAEEADELLQTGALWAEGFRAATEAFAADWVEPDMDSEEGRWYDDCLMRVMALMLPPTDLAAYTSEAYPGETISREELIDDACFGVQDLRVYWLDHAPKPETRRVEPTPGRNDICPCGSGKKYKKCHGAA